MASISSMINGSASSLSSIYGSRNVLSGLASGMDTESMIENAVSGIKTKIENLYKKRTKVEWQQEAYRSIIDKAVDFSSKYTSYSSKTNLLSSSFFSNAVNTAVLGTYADKITASGKSSSDIKINAVKQLATAAAYTVSGLAGMSGGEIAGVSGKDFDIAGTIPVSTVSGSLTFQYGGTNGASFDIKFDELEDLNEVEVLNADGTVKADASSAEKLAQAIQNKLSEVTYAYTKNGFQETTTADKAVKVTVNPDGRITFSDGLGNGNSVKISSSSGNMKAIAGDNVISPPTNLTRDIETYNYLSDKELGITFNGVTKKISLADVIKNTNVEGADPNQSFADSLQKELDSAFGAGKVNASCEGGRLSFTPSGKGDVLALGGSAVKALGFESGDANYINTGKKLTDILGSASDSVFSQENRLKGVGGVTQKTSPNGTVYYVDGKGSRVDKDGFRIESDGRAIYDLQINGAHINVTEDTTLESLMNSINSNSDAGVKVSYSRLTNEFKFTATETGANGRIEFGGAAAALFGDTGGTLPKADTRQSVSEILGGDYDYAGNSFKLTIDGREFDMTLGPDTSIDELVQDMNGIFSVLHDEYPNMEASFDSETNSLTVKDRTTGNALDVTYEEGAAKDLFGKLHTPVMAGSYTSGQDAVIDAEINGVRFENLTRAANTFDLDGLSVNVKGTFEAKAKEDGGEYEPVTFKTTTDADKIVDTIREFVNDYNAMATELKNAYSTMPAKKTNGSRYEPLTSDQMSGMSDKEIEAYEEKAKQGILFGDSTLSSMYSRLLSAITPGGSDGQALREIGIGTSYSSGMTTISLDEDKLRAALESDPDKVKNAFTKTKEGGSASDGLMKTMQNTLNTYVKTTGEPKGALIVRAGSMKAPTTINSNSLQTQINSIDNQIERWQNKMSDQIDRYTSKFSRLEQLIAEMNSQASAFAGLMGGDSGY